MRKIIEIVLQAVAAGFVVSAIAVTVSSADVDLPRTTVCELSANPQRFISRTVLVVGAFVHHNGVDISMLADPSCPGETVSLRITDDPEKLKGLKKFRSALFERGEVGTLGKEIRGDFIGPVKMVPFINEQIPAIVVEAVENLSVRIESEKPKP